MRNGHSKLRLQFRHSSVSFRSTKLKFDKPGTFAAVSYCSRRLTRLFRRDPPQNRPRPAVVLKTNRNFHRRPDVSVFPIQMKTNKADYGRSRGRNKTASFSAADTRDGGCLINDYRYSGDYSCSILRSRSKRNQSIEAFINNELSPAASLAKTCISGGGFLLAFTFVGHYLSHIFIYTIR